MVGPSSVVRLMSLWHVSFKIFNDVRTTFEFDCCLCLLSVSLFVHFVLIPALVVGEFWDWG